MIFRSPHRSWIFGVAAGLSERTGIQSKWIRLSLVISQLFLWDWTWVAYLAAGLLLRQRSATWTDELSPSGRAFVRARRCRSVS